MAKNTFFQGRMPMIFGVLLVALLMIFTTRMIAEHNLKKVTQQQAISPVSVVIAKPGPLTEEVVLPGNVTAWHEATIYARTSGYIKQWYVDIGAHVKMGQLLAEIVAPEVDAQLSQADADLKTATAYSDLANLTATRWTSLVKVNAVPKQDADIKVGDAKALAATVNSSNANKNRLSVLVDFQKILAPFDGVITSRTTDIGALINAGSGENIVPLFHIVQSNPLRVYVKIPQNYTSQISPNMTVTLHFAEHPGKSYPAKLLETAKAIDKTTRTLLAQFEVDNTAGELLAGGYTEVHLTLPESGKLIRLPVNTLLFRAEGLSVATVNKDNTVVLKPVTISRDFGSEVEISTGLTIGDKVILNPPDSLLSGAKVRII